LDFRVNQKEWTQFDFKVSSGYYEINLFNNSVLLSQNVFLILGIVQGKSHPGISTLRKFIHPEDRIRFFYYYDNAVSTNSKFELSCRVIAVGGITKLIYITGQIHTDDRWGAKKLYGTVLDLSTVLSLKLKLSNEEAKYRNLVENSPLGIGIYNKYEVEYANPALLDILGYNTLNELREKSVLEHTHPDDRGKLINIVAGILADKFNVPLKLSYRIVRKDKAIRYVESYLTDCMVNGMYRRQMLVLDVTERVLLKEERRKLAADALYINQQKSMLLEIKGELDRVINLKNYYKTHDFQKIYEIIESYSKLDKDWDLFKIHFEKIHPGFFSRLKCEFPVLSFNDLKHCSCIKMNFNTKETARFFSIKVSSVQIARVRIKKKMHLAPEIDLKNYIMNY
jgi:PAS domain S-box-containing protein